MRLRQVGRAALAVALAIAAARGDNVGYTAYSFGDNGRNEVATTSFSLLKTLFDRTRLLLDIELDQTTIPPLEPDQTSGASRPARQGKSAFLKNRGQIIAGLQRDLFANTEITGNYYFSQEADYRSQAGIAGITQSFAEKNFTIQILGQYTLDSVGEIRDDGSLLNRLKEVHKGALRVTQLLSPVSYVRMGLDGQRDLGFLSDPYRKDEHVPSTRYRGAGWIEYDRFLVPLDASWSAEYRYAFDDWDLASHTLWLKLNKYVTPDWILSAQYRYYIQTGIDFGAYANDDPGLYSAGGDYKLENGEYHFLGLGLNFYLRAFCRRHPSWDFLRRSSVLVKYSRYFNDAARDDSFAGNLLESSLRFDF